MSHPPVTATMRLQFNSGFTLHDAAAQVPHFARLGISHIYASPLLKARPDSAHGYDVVDASCIDPRLGGEPALERLVQELRRHNMGLIVDVVPNHMAVVGGHNAWWSDVLKYGADSAYARFFDIDWEVPDPATCGRVLLPFLRQDYGQALQDGGISLQHEPATDDFVITHYEHRFPISPESREFVMADCANRSAIEQCLNGFHPATVAGQKRLHALLEKQHYRLASWRTADDDINWRRFFNVNELAAVRVEDPVVFEAVHEKIFELLQRGWIDGLRIDHVDGLANPRAYCRKLRRRAEAARSMCTATGAGTGAGAGAGTGIALYVEKILAPDERVPTSWGVSGSTGYEFMNQVSLLLHHPDGEQPLTRLWAEFSGRTPDFSIESYQARRSTLLASFTAELESLVDDLRRLACHDRRTRDLSRNSMRRALIELIAHFPVYRSYANACGRSGDDERFFRTAFERAGASLSPLDWPALQQLDDWLGGVPLRSQPPGVRRQLHQRVVTRFQQLTSPTAAKGVEDTAFYRAGVLLSRYEVGFNAEQFSAPLQLFHAECEYRATEQPATLLTTATHDNKRGEDVRARLAVLSQCAEWYTEQARHWLLLAEPLCHTLPGGSAPTPGDQLILFQTVLGTWPFADDIRHGPLLPAAQLPENYLQRLRDWQYKALREAKLHTCWTAHNEPYEQACIDFLTRLLSDPQAKVLRQRIGDVASKIAVAGALNSLSQCVLRMTTPGVPDLYQSAELWDLALVDPDNRRPVDFNARQKFLTQPFDIDQLLTTWHTGAIKQSIIQRTLKARQQQPELWLQGDYIALPIAGTHADRVLAFARRHNGRYALVIVPIRSAHLLGVPQRPERWPMVPVHHWRNTEVTLPETLCGRRLHSIYSATHLSIDDTKLAVGNLLGCFPVNIYITADKEASP